MSQGRNDEGEVSKYVRRRMRDELPPDFVSGVMTEVQAIDQARSARAWPILAGLATVLAATVLVAIGLGLVDGGDVGGSPAPSIAVPSQSPVPSASEAAPSESPPTASPSPTTRDGEFGPVHAMTPTDAFGPDARECEVTDAVVNLEVTDITFAISYPAEWHANEATPERQPCSIFAPEPFDVPEGGGLPASAAITIDIPFGGDFDPLGPAIDTGRPTPQTVITEEYTVDGVAALRYEFPAEAGSPTGVIWVVAVDGSLPGPGNDRPYLFLAAPGATDPARAEELNNVLDRMVATLDIDTADGAGDDD